MGNGFGNAPTGYRLSGVWLDCGDTGSTLTSLAFVVGSSQAELERALRDYDESRLDDREDPQDQMPRDVFKLFNTDAVSVTARLAGAFYFRGTRVLDPGKFWARGILPLDAMIEAIWATLYELVRQERSDEEWTDLRSWVETDGGFEDGRLYRFKTRDRFTTARTRARSRSVR